MREVTEARREAEPTELNPRLGDGDLGEKSR